MYYCRHYTGQSEEAYVGILLQRSKIMIAIRNSFVVRFSSEFVIQQFQKNSLPFKRALHYRVKY